MDGILISGKNNQQPQKNRLKRIVLFVSLSLVVILVCFLAFCNYFIREAITSYDIVPLKNESTNEKIYIKRHCWGVTGDYNWVVISTSPAKDYTPDSTSEYLFRHQGFEFFYKIDSNKIDVYVSEVSQIPENFESGFEIVQHELSRIEITKLFRTYTELGLKKL